MRVLVCGGREFHDKAMAFAKLDELLNGGVGVTLVIHGGANGADYLAGRYAEERDLECREYPADWATHRRAAGPIRNQKMLDDGRPDLVIAFPGGRGTADMVRRARAAGVRVEIVTG